MKEFVKTIWIRIIYFATDITLCGKDFDKIENSIIINEKYILSISQPNHFVLPISGDSLGKYFTVTLINNQIYHIKGDRYDDLINNLDML